MASTENETYEDVIKETNPELYGRIVGNIDLIPLFDSPQGWYASPDAVWQAIYRELAAADQFDDVLSSLNMTNGKFYAAYEGRYREFIDACPTLTWVMLLGTHNGDLSALRMLLTAKRLDFIADGLKIIGPIEHHEAYLRASSLVNPKTLTNPIIKSIRRLDDALALRPRYLDSKWTISVVETKTIKGVDTDGFYYYAVVFAVSVNFLDMSSEMIPDDAIVYYLNSHSTQVLLRPWSELLAKIQSYAASNKPLALTTLAEMMQMGMNSLPNSTIIPSEKVAKVIYENKLLRFDAVWANSLNRTTLPISQDALSYLLDLTIFDNEEMVQAILPILFKHSDVFVWFITQTRIIPSIQSMDRQHHLLDWFTTSMIATGTYQRSVVFKALIDAGIKLWTFDHVRKLLNDLSFVHNARYLLDFDLAFIPTTTDWELLLLDCLKLLDFRTDTIVTKILETGTVTQDKLNSIILSFNHNIKALKEARKKNASRAAIRPTQ